MIFAPLSGYPTAIEHHAQQSATRKREHGKGANRESVVAISCQARWETSASCHEALTCFGVLWVGHLGIRVVVAVCMDRGWAI